MLRRFPIWIRLPEHRVNSQFVHFVDEDNKIVTQDFTERFIQHGGIGLAPQSVSKLPLNHAEDRFHIGTEMVVLQELFRLY